MQVRDRVRVGVSATVTIRWFTVYTVCFIYILSL